MTYILQTLDNQIAKDHDEEYNRIITEMKQTIFNLKTKEETQTWLCKYQLSLHEHKKHPHITEKSDKILYHIETNYFNFINNTLPISTLGFNKLFNNQIKATINNLQTTLDNKLLQSISHLFLKNQQCTVYDAQYQQQFWKNYTTDFDIHSQTHNDFNFENFLIAQNYNTPLFFNHLTKQIIDTLQEHDDPFLQEQVLLGKKSDYQLISTKIGTPFKTEYPHLKKQLSNWLKVEIKKCHKKQNKYNTQQLSIITEPVTKLKMTISVAQTALLFKLLTATGIISNKTHTDVLTFISAHFSTPKAEEIAFESIHNKYYNVHESTKESVQLLLYNMIDKIKSINPN